MKTKEVILKLLYVISSDKIHVPIDDALFAIISLKGLNKKIKFILEDIRKCVLLGKNPIPLFYSCLLSKEEYEKVVDTSNLIELIQIIEKKKYFFDSFKLKRNENGKSYKNAYLFYSSLSEHINKGSSIFCICENLTILNKKEKDALKKDIQYGYSLADSLYQTRISFITPLDLMIIKLAEQNGNLSKALAELSNIYKDIESQK